MVAHRHFLEDLMFFSLTKIHSNNGIRSKDDYKTVGCNVIALIKNYPHPTEKRFNQS